MAARVERPTVRDGYDRWSETYDASPNALVTLARRYTMGYLAPRPGERILDAGCGTGANLAQIADAGGRPAGVDVSLGMLRVAKRRVPSAALVQADLDAPLPVLPGIFDAVLCALVSEHLRSLPTFFASAFDALVDGGRLVFSAFHPELAADGVEAKFERDGIEYRLGAVLYTVGEYLDHMAKAGFRILRSQEYEGDAALAAQVPTGGKYLGRRMLLLALATKPAAPLTSRAASGSP